MDEKMRLAQYEQFVKPWLPFDPSQYLIGNGFFTAPASTKYHGAYEGGLFDHSYNVMEILLQLTVENSLKWQRLESPYIVGFFHDLCKIDQYVAKPGLKIHDDATVFVDGGFHYEFNTKTLLKGHGDKSVMLLSTLGQLTEEEVACIRYHMGAFTDKEQWADYTSAIHKWPNVLWTHHADMIATHIKEA